MNQTTDRVRDLHARGMSTNAIARTLDLPRGDIAPLVRQLQQTATDPTATPTVSCWVSPGWSLGLTLPEGHGWPDRPGLSPADTTGIVSILVAREGRRGTLSVTGYLVDTYCLGVKDAMGPRRMTGRGELDRFARLYFEPFGGAGIEVPVELVRQLVWGALAHADGLGLKPHRDFRAASRALEALDAPSVIGFGRNGVPTYIAGPYDDVDRVMATLDRSVGLDNVRFTVPLDLHQPA